MTEDEAFAAAVERGAFAGMSLPPYRRREQLAEGVSMLLGNCLDVLPTLSGVDHVIGDPPYEDELHKAFGRKIDRNDGDHLPRSVNMLQPLEFSGINGLRDDVAQVAARASSGWVIFFTLAEGVRAWRDSLQAAGAKWDTTCFWVKPDASPRFNGQGPARGAECFVTCWAGKGYRSWNGGGKRGIYTHLVNYQRQGEHPTEKPVPLMSEIILDFTKPGELICDPFCGSGSTGVAAVKAGRRFIGIEQNERWFDLSCKRISEALKQGDLFIAPPKPAEQTSLPLSPTSGAA
jgi:site-specific DNA-methyltransferase (adenine-specific)